MMMPDSSLQPRTQRHYDSHPFDAITPADELQPTDMQPKPFVEFCERYLRGRMAVADIGCGPGRATMYLLARGAAVTALDISAMSITRAHKRAPDAHFVQGTAVALPFGDASFDLVVADGVIHHTPDARTAFAESVRVLRPDGFFYLGIYNRRRHYYYLYTYAGPPISWMARTAVGRAALSLTLIPVYYLAHLIKSRGKRTWQGATNFFYDYLITPQATFHTREEVAAWGKALDLNLVKYDASLGNVHVFVFRKPVSRLSAPALSSAAGGNDE
jgi:ubiquinone/menaquinone biosynthesis C-methylase UbiE